MLGQELLKELVKLSRHSALRSPWLEFDARICAHSTSIFLFSWTRAQHMELVVFNFMLIFF